MIMLTSLLPLVQLSQFEIWTLGLLLPPRKKMEKVRYNQGSCCLSKTVQECWATLTRIWLSVLPGPCRLPSIHRLNLQQVGAFSLTVKHRLRVDESQLWVNAKIFVVPAAIL